MTLTDWKDIATIAFYLTIGIVTVMTFARARKTLLQPMRTEVFKKQLEVFGEILGVFGGKTEHELRAAINWDFLVLANASALFDRYARLFFDAKPDLPNRPYRRCRRALMLADAEVSVMDGHVDEQPPAQEAPDPRIRPALWAKYRHDTLYLPDELSAFEDRIQKLSSHPLVPQKCAELLRDYVDGVNKNLSVLRDIMTKAAQELPEKYPSPEMLNRSTLYWLQSRFIDQHVDLEPRAKAISDYLRGYFQSDALLT